MCPPTTAADHDSAPAATEQDAEPPQAPTRLAPATRRDTPPPRPSLSARERLDPNRIRGDALRRSLFYTTVAWIPGAFWFSATNGATSVKFLEHLAPDDPGLRDLLFGLMGAAMFIGVLFQIPGALCIQWLGRRKGLFLWWLTIQRILYVFIAALPWILPARYTPAAVLMVGLLILAWSAGQFGGQAWVNWMADLVPQRVRGKYFARRSRIGIVVMGLSAVLVGAVLDASGAAWFRDTIGPAATAVGMPPLIFVISIIYSLAAIAGIVDIQLFRKVDEPPMKVTRGESIMQRLLKPLRDGEFGRYVLYLSAFNFALAFCGAFWMVYFFHFFDSQKGSGAWWLDYRFLAAAVLLQMGYHLGQFAGLPLWGKMIDRFGRKPVIYISSLLHTLTWIPWMFLSPALMPYLILVQLFGGFFGSGFEVANFNMLLGYNRKGGPGYQAVAGVIVAAAQVSASFLAGFVAYTLAPPAGESATLFTFLGHDFNRYTVIIVVGLAIKILADLVFLTRVHDLEAKPASHAARFLMASMYDTLNTGIFTVRTHLEGAGRKIVLVKDTLAGTAGGTFRRWWR